MSNDALEREKTSRPQTGQTWTEVRSRFLASAIVPASGALEIRPFSGEPLSAVFDLSSGHTYVLNETAVDILSAIADGQSHPVRQLAQRQSARNVDNFLQTVISLRDKGLAKLVPLDDNSAMVKSVGAEDSR